MRQNITYCSRSLVLAALLTLALLPARGIAAVDDMLAIDLLRPGQTHIGRANIQNMVEENVSKTKDYNSKVKNKDKQRTPLENYQAKLNAPDAKSLPVVRTPDGKYMLL